MLCDAYRDENGVNRCEQISSDKRCIIHESMTLHQSLEVALWAVQVPHQRHPEHRGVVRPWREAPIR